MSKRITTTVRMPEECHAFVERNGLSYTSIITEAIYEAMRGYKSHLDEEIAELEKRLAELKERRASFKEHNGNELPPEVDQREVEDLVGKAISVPRSGETMKRWLKARRGDIEEIGLSPRQFRQHVERAYEDRYNRRPW